MGRVAVRFLPGLAVFLLAGSLPAQRPSYLHVSSWGTHKIQRFEGGSGEFVDTFARSEDLVLPLGLAFVTALIFRSYPPPGPGPQEIEATLAEGFARFTWWNPDDYSEILVLAARRKRRR